MTGQPKLYRRLPGASTSFGSYHRLYAGPDHLLHVEATGFSEKYRRFYYRDIQAVVIQQTSLRMVLGWVFGIPALLCLGFGSLALAASNADWVGAVVMSGVTLVFALPFLVNLLAGPTCACYVRTAVQMEKLPALGRQRTARKFLDRLMPLVLAAQQNEPAGQPVESPQPSESPAAESSPTAPTTAADGPNPPGPA